MLHIIINPTAGNGRAARIGKSAAEALAAQNMLHGVSYTNHPGHATMLTKQAAQSGASTVIAVGGDGTVREVLLGLSGTDTALGIVPAGTGNDGARMLSLPKKPMDALSFILHTPARRVDVGTVNDSFFFNVCGTGFDVHVLDYAQKAKRYVRGMLPYLWGVLRTIFTFNPVDAVFEVDGEPPQRRKVLIVAIANGKCFGGGITIAPDSHPDDGLLDLVLVDAMPRRKIVFQLPRLVSGRVQQIPGYQMIRCKDVRIESDSMRVNVDGELLSLPQAQFTIRPGHLLAHW